METWLLSYHLSTCSCKIAMCFLFCFLQNVFTHRLTTTLLPRLSHFWCCCFSVMPALNQQTAKTSRILFVSTSCQHKVNRINKHSYLNCRHYVDTNCKELIKLQERVEAASHVKKAHFPQLGDWTVKTTSMSKPTCDFSVQQCLFVLSQPHR